MKKLILFAAAALMMSSCSMLQKSSAPAAAAAPTVGTTATVSNPSTAGLNAGVALMALYKQYQIDGKFNASNLQNIANAATLIANCQELKANYSNKEYRQQFNQGLLGSAAQSLITPTNVNTVSNSLVDIATAALNNAKNSETAANATAAATNAANTAAAAVSNAADKASSYAQTAASAASTVASAANSITTLLSLFGGAK